MPTPLAVIPWFELPSFSLGPFTIQSFGILSAIGILVAVQLAAKAARELGKDPQVILDFAVAGVLTGVVVGHLVHLLFYHREELQDPLRIFKFWEGLSSMGGLLGGILAAAIWFRRKKIRFADYADAFALGIAPGWGIARVGCFTVHDHPGIRSSFFLAVNWNDGGGPRHDLGLYEAIALFAMGGILWALHRRGVLRGRLLSLLALMYGVTRFFLDFLRARPGDVPYADGRQWGLTFAQWFCFLLVANGIRGLVQRPAAASPVRRSTAAAGG